MSWRNISLIYMREVRDQLRDRRTLFMVAVLPLLLYPALGIGMMQMTMLFTEQPRTVVVLGADSLPKHPQLLVGHHIVENWFELPQDAEKLHVVTDFSSQPDITPEAVELLAQAKQIRDTLAKRDDLENQILDAKTTEDDVDNAEIERLRAELTQTRHHLSELFSASHMQVLILIPDDFGKNIAAVNQQLADRQHGDPMLENYDRPVILRNSADEKSLIAYRRVHEAINSWEREILKQRLTMADLPADLPSPVNADPVDLAEDDQISAHLWSKLFPALLVIMAVTGAFYPAVDLAAGEKERGTMETLLICPATRAELVMGKFLTVMLFSMSTALLNLASMGMTGRYMVSIAGAGAFSKVGGVSFPSGSALFWLLVLLVPLAALFSALCLALATFARSTKEGQYYLTPLLMVTLGMTVFCMSPAVEINPFYSIMPVMGIALLLKGLLLSSVHSASLYIYVIPVLATSIGYSLLALWWAIDQFKSEEVLFREAERFEVGLWFRHLLRDKEPTPSFSEGGFCFVLIMLMQFVTLKVMQDSISGSDEASRGTLMVRLLMIQQLVIIASPAMFMGVMLTTSVVRTFRLRLPSLKFLVVAAFLPLALHPLSLEMLSRLDWFFPHLPESVVRAIQTMSDPDLPLWLVLLAFAGAPALCEELAFRGFILSGFQRSQRTWLAIVLSSLTFGVMHMIPQQVFNASLMGLVLGLIAIRSNSLLPCIVFHFVNNCLGVAHGRIPVEWAKTGPASFFFEAAGDPAVHESLRYRWPTLLIAAAVAIFLLRWVVNQPSKAGGPSKSQDEFQQQAGGIASQGLEKPAIGART